MRRITDPQRRALLGARHLLTRRGDTVTDVADAMVALHATDAATVFLSAFARQSDPSVAAVEQALYTDVALHRMLAMRRTMFVVPDDLAPVVWSAAGRAVAARERAGLVKFLAEAGYSASWLAGVEKSTISALAGREATVADLGVDVPELREQITVAVGKPYEATQSVGTRLIRVLAAEGLIRRSRPRGGWTSSQFRWTAAVPFDDVPDAKAALVRHWLARYGPATEADVKWWTGWTATDVRKALAVCAEPVLLDDGSTGYALPDLVVPDVEPWAAVLPALDPTAMGWQERSWYLPADRSGLFDRSGNIGPTVWWSGQVVGAWAQRPDGSLAWEALASLPRAAVKAVSVELDRLAALLGDVRITPRFRTPLERQLSS